MKNYLIDLSVYDRFALYAQKAVNQGAFIPVGTLIERFLKATKRSSDERQKDRYRKHLRELGPNLGLRFEYISANRGKKLYVTSVEKTFFNDDHQKEDDIIYAFLKAVKASHLAYSKVYEVLREISKSSQSTLERIVKVLKSRAIELGLSFIKKGRALYAQFRRKKAWKNTPQKGDISYYKKAKDSKYINTPCGEVRFSSKAMRKKAFFIMRQLKKQFYDNVKVKICERMLFRFCEWAIQGGFEDSAIERTFNYALLERHKDATDMGLNNGICKFMFEMSSTVSLAKELMAGDGLTASERWEKLKKIGNLKKGNPEPVPEETEVKEDLTEEVEENSESNDTVFEFPPMSFLSDPKTPEEEEEEFLLKRGFQKPHVVLFRRFQKKLLHGAEARLSTKHVIKMGLLLAEHFEDRSEYDLFRGNG